MIYLEIPSYQHYKSYHVLLYHIRSSLDHESIELLHAGRCTLVLKRTCPSLDDSKGEFWVHQIVCQVTAIARDWDLFLHNEEIFTSGPLGITVSSLVWPDAL